jgi:hypothetical protein
MVAVLVEVYASVEDDQHPYPRLDVTFLHVAISQLQSRSKLVDNVDLKLEDDVLATWNVDIRSRELFASTGAEVGKGQSTLCVRHRMVRW